MRFNGLKPRILDMIATKEGERIELSGRKIREIHWAKIDGGKRDRNGNLTLARTVFSHDGTASIYMSSCIRGYCQYITCIRHEFFHAKHLKTSLFTERFHYSGILFRIFYYLLNGLLVELPARLYERSGLTRVFCKKCPIREKKKRG